MFQQSPSFRKIFSSRRNAAGKKIYAESGLVFPKKEIGMTILCVEAAI